MVDLVDFGDTGLCVSRLGLGTVELGLPYGLSKEPPPADADCIRLLRDAVEGGIRFIDTAAAYGRSEELVGRAFDGVADRPVIATKVALRDADGNPLPRADVAAHVQRSVEQSLGLLRTTRLDVLMIHSVEHAFLCDELVEAMEAQVTAGRVAFWGASTYGDEAPAEALGEQRLRTLQVAYNVLDRQLGETILPRARARGVAIVLRSVFLQGVLSDRRRHLPRPMAALSEAAERAAGIAADAGIGLSAMALRYALFSGAGDVTLVGTARDDELRQNLAAAQAGPLPTEVVSALEQIEVSDRQQLNPGTWPKVPVPAAPTGG